MKEFYPGIYRRITNRTALFLSTKIIVLYLFTLLIVNRSLAGYAIDAGTITAQSAACITDGTHTARGNLILSGFINVINKRAGSFSQPAAPADQAVAQLKINLYAIETNGSASLVDGVLNQFSDKYSDAIDQFDAEKAFNFAENLDIKSHNHLLVVERKQPITSNDSIHLNMTGMKVKSYRFEFIGTNFNPSINAFLEDSLYNTRIPLTINDTSRYDFNVVNVPGSWNPSRFRVVFEMPLASPLPITFSSVKAYQQSKNITVEWKTENEKNMKQYEVEKSADGQHFTKAAVIAAKLNNDGSAYYQWLDVNSFAGNNYYRIKSIDVNGGIQYSTIVKVFTGQAISQIIAYPNPLTDGNINLQLVDQPKGIYSIRLINGTGQVIINSKIDHSEGSSTETLRINSTLPHGAFHLEITKPDNTQLNINVLN